MIDQEKYVKVIANPLEKQSAGEQTVNNVDATFTENGIYVAEQPYTGFGTVTVAVPNATESTTITTNGTFTPTSPNIGFNSVTVNVPNRTYNTHIGQNGTFYPGAGYIGFSRVTVNVPDKTFLGLTLDQLNGSVSNGVISRGTGGSLDFTGITEIGEYGLYYTFYYKNITGDITFANITTIGYYGMYYAFYNTTGLTSFTANNVTSVDYEGMYYAFGYSRITTATMNGLTSITNNYALQNTFRGSYLTTLNLPNLETISGVYGCDSICRSCSSLTTVNMPKLKAITSNYGLQYGFYSTHLTTYTFESLDTLTGYYALARAFGSNSYLQTLYFPKLKSTSFGSDNTNQFYYMLTGCSNVTVHFPSNLQSVIGSWTDVTTGFNGTNTTVLFDLPATE